MNEKLGEYAPVLSAIHEALENGWQIPFEEPITLVEVSDGEVNGTHQTQPYIKFVLDGSHDWCVGIPHVIYDHDFARALWGEDAYGKITQSIDGGSEVKVRDVPAWEYHLQQMVIADDPVKYLGENI